MKSKIIHQAQSSPPKPTYPRLWKLEQPNGVLIYMEMENNAVCILDSVLRNGEMSNLGYIITGPFAHKWDGWTQITAPIIIQYSP